MTQSIEINVLLDDGHEFGRQRNSFSRIKITNGAKINDLKKRAIEKVNI